MTAKLKTAGVLLFFFCMAASEVTANGWWLLGWLVSFGLVLIAEQLENRDVPPAPRLGGYIGDEE